MHYEIKRRFEKLEKSARPQKTVPIIKQVGDRYFLNGKEVDLEQLHREYGTIVIDDIV